MTQSPPLEILVTNDDGIFAPGIRLLASIAKKYGNVTVVAPNKPQSGMSSAITLGKPLRINKVDFIDGVQAFTCSGTPVDCVKLGVDKLCDKKPDLCLSGINHGSNGASNVIYSGTMAAALEGAMQSINSIGFSFLTSDHDADMAICEKAVNQVMERAMQYGFPPSRLLNVNIPEGGPDDLKGIKICRQANAAWKESYDERIDPFGRKYYWLAGEFVNYEPENPQTDLYALATGYASVVPTEYDLTGYASLDWLNQNWKNEI